jgi:hypothetical protein
VQHCGFQPAHGAELRSVNFSTGYLSAEYAAALAEFGAPRQLPTSQGWLLQRPVPDSDCFDAMGCYPLFCCRNWDGLASDLAALAPELVSVTLVTDPFASFDPDALQPCFPDLFPHV